MSSRSGVTLRALGLQLRDLPLALVARRGFARLVRSIRDAPRRSGDLRRSTYGDGSLPQAPLARRLRTPPVERLAANREAIVRAGERARAHEFDLLGSGPVRVAHGVNAAGVEGHRYDAAPPSAIDREGHWLEPRVTAANLGRARSVWRLVDPDYTPIDWQLDFKSGYRWSDTAWYRDVLFGHLPGADIKVPWELARMQHLPRLAWAFAADGGDERYMRELRNQILDFVAQNPPRFGVNWVCTMDVAIRAANWLVGYDLLRATGAGFDAEFERIFFDAVYDHGRHIAGHLEWDPDVQFRGNHYLADVVGLLFVAAYLPSAAQTDAWLGFALRELAAETDRQFGPDGASFEASTCYHRLSAELVAYATALASSLEPERLRTAAAADPAHVPRLLAADGSAAARPPVPIVAGSLTLPSSHLDRLERMAEFTVDVTKPDGRVAQIGDNDSGRFLEISPVDPKDSLDHRHLVAALNGILGRADLARATADFAIESEIVASLLSPHAAARPAKPARLHAAATVRRGEPAEWIAWRGADAQAPHRLVRRFDARREGSLRDGLTLRGYPNFGLWLFRSPRLFLAIRCGSIGQNGKGGHAHNDQLAIELTIDGADLVRDPGTYLYTPLPKRRDEYRSVAAHFAPRVAGQEPGSLDLGPFRIGDQAHAAAIFFGAEGFVGKHQGFGAEVFRRVEVLNEAVLVTDWSALELVDAYSPPPFSPGYGLRDPQG